jgi:DNA-binding transcriptional MerR regulator
MQIGVVAKRIGLSVDAIRFYERQVATESFASDRVIAPS